MVYVSHTDHSSEELFNGKKVPDIELHDLNSCAINFRRVLEMRDTPRPAGPFRNVDLNFPWE